MYEWMWRHLPGPWPVRALICVALLAVVVVVLFQWGFPALAPLMPFNDGTVGD
ncbi:MAG TPA: hypothetical protein VFL94_05615 [Actinomycetales bacterium]|nr:hypothetical protein [Actinomycetales bacterium]